MEEILLRSKIIAPDDLETLLKRNRNPASLRVRHYPGNTRRGTIYTGGTDEIIRMYFFTLVDDKDSEDHLDTSFKWIPKRVEA